MFLALSVLAGGGALTRYCWKRYQHKSLELYLSLLEDESLDEATHRLQAEAEAAVEALDPERIQQLPAELDLVSQGGGFRVMYTAGVNAVLEALQRRYDKPQVRRRAGASAGAQLSLVLHNGAGIYGMRWARAVARVYSERPYTRPEPLWRHFLRNVATQRELPVPGQLHVAVTELRLQRAWPPIAAECRMVSDFSDHDDLTEAVMASGALPLAMCGGFASQYRGRMVTDGGATDNLPIFEDGARPQLVCSYKELPERFCKIFGYSDADVLDAVALGIRDAVRLFAHGEPSPCLRLVHPHQVNEVPRQKDVLRSIPLVRSVVGVVDDGGRLKHWSPRHSTPRIQRAAP